MLTFSEHLFPKTPWSSGFCICLKTKVWKFYFRRAANMLSSLSLRPDSDLPIYGYRYLSKKVERIMEAMTLNMLRSQRQYIPDLNLLFRCLAAINTDFLCILFLSTNCSLSVTKSCIIHLHSKTTLHKVSKLMEL